MSVRLFLRSAQRMGAYKRALKAGASGDQARLFSDAVYPPTPEDLAYEASAMRGPSPARRLWRLYITIGVILALPMFGSYLFAAVYLVWLAGFAGLLPGAFSLVVGAGSGVFRIFDWLPSLVLWLVIDNHYSFIDWLAPGLDVGILDQPTR